MNQNTDQARFFLLAAALDEAEVVIDMVATGRIAADATWGGKPSALCYAALHGNLELVHYLLAEGAGVEFHDALDMTPLHYAALGGCQRCWRTLIEAGAAVSVRNRFGRSPTCLREQRRDLRPAAAEVALNPPDRRRDSGGMRTNV